MISGKTNYEEDDAENSFIKEVEPEYRSKPKHLLKNEHKKWINQGNALNFDLSYSLLNLADNLEEKLMTIEKVIKLSEMEQYKEFQSFKHEKQVEYVFNSNVGENVGHQSLNETSFAIQQYKEGKELNSNEYKETINTLKALNFLNETRCEMQASILIKSEIHHSIFLNEDIVKECHSILMEGLAANNGFYRKKQACTIRDNNTLHYYVDQELISNRCEGLIDYYNTNVDQFLPGYELKIENLFKLASFLAFNFVDVHPFSDGNGRLARLLANHVLSLCLPFPVTFSKDRAEYISIIEKCRYSNTTWHLTTMLIDATFQFSLDILNRLK